MSYKNFINTNHSSTKRDYIGRVNKSDKAEVAKLALKWDFDYWDGSRDTGYGGYKYDGRWKKVATKMIDEYEIKSGMKILDIGCGKGFLLKDLKIICPNIEVFGIDISKYAIKNAEIEVSDNCVVGNATTLPFPDKYFDLVISINTLHNLYNYELDKGLKEISRVSKKHSFICVESYRNENEKVNLLYWQLTCRIFNTPEEWLYNFKKIDYKGDYEFIYFE